MACLLACLVETRSQYSTSVAPELAAWERGSRPPLGLHIKVWSFCNTSHAGRCTAATLTGVSIWVIPQWFVISSLIHLLLGNCLSCEIAAWTACLVLEVRLPVLPCGWSLSDLDPETVVSALDRLILLCAFYHSFFWVLTFEMQNFCGCLFHFVLAMVLLRALSKNPVPLSGSMHAVVLCFP